MLTKTRNTKALTINIIVFAIAGTLYYIFFLEHKLDTALEHPLMYGSIGIWIPIVGILTVYEYYKTDDVSLYKNSLYAILYSFIYFFGFFILPAIFGQEQGEQIITIWIGLLLVSYFITISALHWYFGFYIAIFNITILALTLSGNMGGEVNPIGWVSIFSLAGINNIFVQWAIVISSATLGLLEKGFDLFGIEN